MIIVGLTGGIGSGKTTVCNVWRECGAYIIDADDLAKKVMTTDLAVKEDLTGTFGPKTFHPNGTLNRKFLAEQAFKKGRVKELNAIVHPKMPEYVQAEIQIANQQGCPLLVYEAALLLKNLETYSLDFVVLVLADEKRRTQWVERRDEVSAASVADRMKNQAAFEKATDKADFVIQNDGSLSELKQHAESLYFKILDAKS